MCDHGDTETVSGSLLFVCLFVCLFIYSFVYSSRESKFNRYNCSANTVVYKKTHTHTHTQPSAVW
jgi:archaellum component FlaF (FlaF/FlaG flagellin family)